MKKMTKEFNESFELLCKRSAEKLKALRNQKKATK